MMKKKTAVLGASSNPQRYSYLAVSRLSEAGHEVIALGKEAGKIGNIDIIATFPEKIIKLDTLSLYINPAIQRQYTDYILGLHPRRIIFNPGTENPELKRLAESKGINTIEACTLVMLRLGTY